MYKRIYDTCIVPDSDDEEAYKPTELNEKKQKPRLYGDSDSTKHQMMINRQYRAEKSNSIKNDKLMRLVCQV